MEDHNGVLRSTDIAIDNAIIHQGKLSCLRSVIKNVQEHWSYPPNLCLNSVLVSGTVKKLAH